MSGEAGWALELRLARLVGGFRASSYDRASSANHSPSVRLFPR